MSETHKAFDFRGMKGSMLTYIFGIPNIFIDQNKILCQGLVTDAYFSAGIKFDHPKNRLHLLNFTKWLGHPLGHRPNEQNPRFNYIKPHDIYADSRFIPIISIYQQDVNGSHIAITDPNKYSWK
jgi:hypothetical protein